jgi:hypothetical protein
MSVTHGIYHEYINNYKISQVYTTKHYKRDLVANPYLFPDECLATRQLLHLNFTSLTTTQERK